MKKNTALINDYLRYFEHTLGRSAGSVDNYGRHLKRLNEFLMAQGTSLTTATTSQLERFVGIEAHKSGFTVNGRRPIVAALRSFFEWGFTHGHIQTNPAQYLKYPSKVLKLPVPISPKNAELLLNSIKLDNFIDIRDAAIIALFLASGLRLSGLRNLNQSNLFEREVDGIDRLFIRVIEKRRKERIIPIPDVMKLIIMVYLSHPDYQKVNAINAQGEKILFINTKNTRVSEADHYGEKRRLSVRYIEQMIKRRGTAIGLPTEQLKPHAIRHLYGTELAEAGVDLHKIQLLMGHANLSTTLQYIHLAQRGLFKAVNESSPLANIHTPFHDLQRRMSHS